MQWRDSYSIKTLIDGVISKCSTCPRGTYDSKKYFFCIMDLSNYIFLVYIKARKQYAKCKKI